MYGPTSTDIFVAIVLALIGLGILWAIIRTAVKSGTLAALHEYDQDKKRMAKYDTDPQE